MADMTEQELLDDLTRLVEDQFNHMVADIPERVVKLHRAGSGVLQEHETAIVDDQRHRVANKVVLALLQEYTRTNQPPRSLDTREFRNDVNNYYQLL